jgi:hypothetical protein
MCAKVSGIPASGTPASTQIGSLAENPSKSVGGVGSLGGGRVRVRVRVEVKVRVRVRVRVRVIRVRVG